MTRADRRPGRSLPGRLGVVLLVLLAACGEEEEKVEVAGPELVEMRADQLMIGLTHNMTRDGVLQGKLRADTAYIFNDESLIHLRTVDVTFFDSRGRRDTRLTADSGRYNLQTGNMQAHGRVVVRDSVDSQRLETPQLLYDALRDELRTDTTFVWEQGTDVVRGSGLITDPSLDNVRIQEPAATSPRSPGSGSSG